jgi:hypothetical protein
VLPPDLSLPYSYSCRASCSIFDSRLFTVLNHPLSKVRSFNFLTPEKCHLNVTILNICFEVTLLFLVKRHLIFFFFHFRGGGTSKICILNIFLLLLDLFGL